jgi:hypothetical protein
MKVALFLLSSILLSPAASAGERSIQVGPKDAEVRLYLDKEASDPTPSTLQDIRFTILAPPSAFGDQVVIFANGYQRPKGSISSFAPTSRCLDCALKSEELHLKSESPIDPETEVQIVLLKHACADLEKLECHSWITDLQASVPVKDILALNRHFQEELFETPTTPLLGQSATPAVMPKIGEIGPK